MLARSIAGDDIFVSYSRLDGIKYAEGLAGELAHKGYSCRIDQWESEPGRELPRSLLGALARASMLVVAGTPGAAGSAQVAREVELFVRTRRPIIPIDFGGSIEQASWYPLIQGLVREPELSPDALTKGLPSEDVLSRIERSFTYRRRNRRIQLIFRWTLAAILVGLAAIGYLVYETIQVSRDRQEVSDELDKTKREYTDVSAGLTSKARELESTQAGLTKAAEDLTQTQMAVLEARREVDRQGRIARSRSLARSAEDLGDQPAKLPLRALLALQAMKSFPTIEAHQALRGALSVMPLALCSYDHGGAITAMAISPDGTLLATAGWDFVRLWDVERGELRRVLKPGGWFTFLKFTGDGNTIFGAHEDVVHVWKHALNEYQPIRARSFVSDAAISPDGRHIVVAERGLRAASVRSLEEKGREVAKLTPAKDRYLDGFSKLAFYGKGRFLASARLGSVILWDTRNWHPVRTLTASGNVQTIVLSPGEELLAVGTERAFQMLDLRAPDSALTTVYPRRTDHVAFHPDGKTVAAGSGGGVRVWEAANGEQKTLIAASGALESLVFSPNGESVGTSGIGVASLSHPVTGAALVHMVHPGRAWLLFDAQNRAITASRDSPRALLWRAESGRTAAIVRGAGQRLAFSEDGKYLATGAGGLNLINGRLLPFAEREGAPSGDGRRVIAVHGERLRVWSIDEDRTIATLEYPGTRATMVAIDHGGAFAVTSHTDGRIRLWDIEKQAVVMDAAVQPGPSYGLRAKFSRNARTVAIQHQRRMEVWHPAKPGTAGAVEIQDPDVADFAVDRTGCHMAIRFREWNHAIYDVESEVREVARFKADTLTDQVLFGPATRFAPTRKRGAHPAESPQWGKDPPALAALFRPGARIAARAQYGKVEIVDLATRKVLRAFPHDGEVFDVVLSEDARYVATSDVAGIRIWDTSNGEEVARGMAGGSPRFSPDGRVLATVSGSTIEVWHWWADDLMRDMCGRLLVNFSLPGIAAVCR